LTSGRLDNAKDKALTIYKTLTEMVRFIPGCLDANSEEGEL